MVKHIFKAPSSQPSTKSSKATFLKSRSPYTKQSPRLVGTGKTSNKHDKSSKHKQAELTHELDLLLGDLTKSLTQSTQDNNLGNRKRINEAMRTDDPLAPPMKDPLEEAERAHQQMQADMEQALKGIRSM